MHSAYGDMDAAGYSEEHLRLFGELQYRVPAAATDGLNTIKRDMIERFNQSKPLSGQIRAYISENITAEQYQIADQEIETLRKSGYLTDVVLEIRKIDEKIRESRFEKMYLSDFSSSVISFASAYHQEYTEEILNTLLGAMEVSNGSPFYQELKEQLALELVPWRGRQSDADQQTDQRYQSLIEQFSRDLYETLIYCPYTDERLRKFYENVDRFFALSVFYRTSDSADNLAYIRIPPEEQPLCKMLLFHDFRNFSGKLSKLSRVLSEVTRMSQDHLKDVDTDLPRLLYAVGGKVDQAASRFEEKFSRALDKSDEFKLNLLKSTIHEICSSGGVMPSIADREAFTTYYKDYHNSLRKGLITLDEMKDDFREDVEVLRDVLMNAFVSAINMDSPFVKHESKSIEEIVHYVQGEAFRTFLRRNLRKIKYTETAQLDRAERERRQNQDIAREVDSILQSLNDG